MQPEPGTADSSTDQSHWQRSHLVTPLIESWQALSALAVIGVSFFAERRVMGQTDLDSAFEMVQERGLTFLLILAALALTLAANLIGWWFRRFTITSQDLEIRAGLIFKSHTRIRLDRMQAVEVKEPFVARIFGFAELDVDVASGEGNSSKISYLPHDQAQALRADLLARAAGMQVSSHESAAEAPASTIYEQSVRGLLLTALMGPLTFLVILAILLVAVAVAVGNPLSARVLVASPLVLLLPLWPAVGLIWSRLNRNFGATVRVSPDGLRWHGGLLEKRAITYPPGRIQAVELSQPFLWRPLKLWNMTLEIAGASIDSAGEDVRLVAAGSAPDCLRVLSYAVPDLGVADPVSLMKAGMYGRRDDGGFIPSQSRAWWLNWAWRRTAVHCGPRVVAVRRGIITRTIQLVPLAKVQSCALQHGLLTRSMGAIDLKVHTVAGRIDWVAKAMPTAVARQLFAQILDAARLERDAVRDDRWLLDAQMQAVSQPQAASDSGIKEDAETAASSDAAAPASEIPPTHP